MCALQMAGGVCPICQAAFVPAPHALGVGLFMCCLFITLSIPVCSASLCAESQVCNNSYWLRIWTIMCCSVLAERIQ